MGRLGGGGDGLPCGLEEASFRLVPIEGTKTNGGGTAGYLDREGGGQKSFSRGVLGGTQT